MEMRIVGIDARTPARAPRVQAVTGRAPSQSRVPQNARAPHALGRPSAVNVVCNRRQSAKGRRCAPSLPPLSALERQAQ